MSRFFTKCYWFLYKRAMARHEPESPKRIVIKEIFINLVRLAIRYYRQ